VSKQTFNALVLHVFSRIIFQLSTFNFALAQGYALRHDIMQAQNCQ